MRASGEANILFVAAAGNGNVLGQGVDNDLTPFYPASLPLENVIAVAASDSNDRLARFTNFGDDSVDVAAPGVGIISTLPGGRYGTANGTSMAAPHVSGAVALLFAELPGARVSEVREAIVESARESITDSGDLMDRLASGGLLSAPGILSSQAFSPTATIAMAEDIEDAGGTSHLIEIRYKHRQGIDTSSISDGDLVIERQWGPRDVLTVDLVSFVSFDEDPTDSIDDPEVVVTYRLDAVGGFWDPLDFGEYRISVTDAAISGNDGTPSRNRSSVFRCSDR